MAKEQSKLKTALTAANYARYIMENNPNSDLIKKAKNKRLVEMSVNNLNIENKTLKEPVIEPLSVSDQVLSFEKNQSTILDVIGKKFDTDKNGNLSEEGFKAVSKAMEIYSDKHFETARYLFVKDGQIIRHLTVSSQVPSATQIKPDENFLHDCRQYSLENDAQIVFLHNHPSGYVEPSNEDIKLTNYLSNFFRENEEKSYFAGHIILDHGTYGLYTDEKKEWNALIEDKIYSIKEVSNRYQIQLTEHRLLARFDPTDRSVSTESLVEMADYAKKCDGDEMWNKKDWIPALLMTNSGVVTSNEMFGVSEILTPDVLAEKLKNLGRKYGSENIVFFPNDYSQFLICEEFAQKTGMVKDVYYEDTDLNIERSNYANGNIFKLSRAEIKIEDTNSYQKEVNDILSSSGSVNRTRDSFDININKENKLMENEVNTEKKVEQDEELQAREDIENKMEEKPSYEELLSIKEELERRNRNLTVSFEKLMEKYNETLQESADLRRDIEILKKEVFNKENKSQEANEQGRNDTQEMGEQGRKEHSSAVFNRDNAYIINTPVPKFGIKDKDTGRIDIYEGARFVKLVENELDNSKNTVVLNLFSEDGTKKELKITEQEYNNIIVAEVNLAKMKHSIGKDENSYEWMVSHMEYNERLNLDRNKYRLNTYENFRHNLRIHVLHECNNLSDAMECASEMFKTMTVHDKERLSAEFEKNPESFNKIIEDVFNQASAEKNITEKDIANGLPAKSALIDESNRSLFEMKYGEKIEGTRATKVGDTVTMAFKTKDIKGKVYKTPAQDLKIVKVTKGLSENRVTLYNEQTKASYTCNLKDVVSHIQKVEIEKSKEIKKQIKKDHKKYGYEGISL